MWVVLLVSLGLCSFLEHSELQGFWVGEYSMLSNGTVIKPTPYDPDPFDQTKFNGWPYEYETFYGFVNVTYTGMVYYRHVLYIFGPAESEFCNMHNDTTANSGKCGVNGAEVYHAMSSHPAYESSPQANFPSLSLSFLDPDNQDIVFLSTEEKVTEAQFLSKIQETRSLFQIPSADVAVSFPPAFCEDCVLTPDDVSQSCDTNDPTLVLILSLTFLVATNCMTFFLHDYCLTIINYRRMNCSSKNHNVRGSFFNHVTVQDFQWLDLDHDGVVTTVELMKGLNRLGIAYQPEDVEALMRQLDANHKGEVTAADFRIMKKFGSNMQCGTEIEGEKPRWRRVLSRLYE